MSDVQTQYRRAAELRQTAADLRKRIDTGEVSNDSERDLFESQAQVALRIADISEQMAKKSEARARREAEHIIEHGHASYDTSDAEVRSTLRYIKTGERPSAEERAVMTVATGSTGGYAVAQPLVQSILKKAHRQNPLLALARTYNIDGGNPTTYVPIMSIGTVTAWLAEAGSRTEQAEPTFAQVTLTASDLAGFWLTTQTWLDSFTDGEQLVIDELGASCMQELAIQLVTGTGTGNKPMGIATGATNGYTYVPGLAASTISNTSILNLIMGLRPMWRVGASLIMSPATLALCLGMAQPFTGATQPLVNFDGEGNAWILGHRVYESEDMPAVATNSYSVAFSSFENSYAIALHRNVFVIRDEVTIPGQVRFIVLFRVAGAPTNTEACVLLKTAVS